MGRIDPNCHQRNSKISISTLAPPSDQILKKTYANVADRKLDKVTKLHHFIAKNFIAVNISICRMGRIDPVWCLRVKLKNYLRMEPGLFEKLFTMVYELITTKNTRFR